MPIPTKLLSVVANPYIHLDHMGRPAGACPELFDGKAPRRKWIGCKLVAVQTKAAVTASATNAEGQTVVATDEDAEHDVTFEYETDPATGEPAVVKVPNDPYYRGAILRHELFAADEETWRACGMRAGFTPPSEMLKHHETGATARYVQHYGEEYADEVKAPAWQKHKKAGDAPAAPALNANVDHHEEV